MRPGIEGEDLLDQVEHVSAVTIGHRAQGRASTGIQRQGAADLGLGPLHQEFEPLVIEPFEDQHLAA